MKKENQSFLSRNIRWVISITILLGATITFLSLFVREQKHYKGSMEVGVLVTKAFFGAKDSLTCVLDMMQDKVSYTECDKYVEQTITDYQKLSQNIGDFSNYNAQE